MTQENAAPTLNRYVVTGMDCTSCAAKIEKAARGVAGVDAVEVSIATQRMTLTSTPAAKDQAEQAITALGYKLQPLNETGEDLDDEILNGLENVTPGYRRALWIVVILNAGYGVIEAAGGYITGSQALKADSLDFLGDGVITFIGLLAIGWSLLWRARAALIQGIFLGILGIGVLVDTIRRVSSGEPPEALLMGGFALVALAVNVAAALVLIPHREGDSNMRAVWLFSRNDAIGNAAVVIAAGVVALTNSHWPDLIVAFAIAALFLQSSWSIIRHARRDLAGLRKPA